MLQFKEKWPKFQIVNQRYEQQDNNYRYYQHSKPRPSYQPQPYWFFCSHVKTRGMRFKPVPEFKQPASHSHVQKKQRNNNFNWTYSIDMRAPSQPYRCTKESVVQYPSSLSTILFSNKAVIFQYFQMHLL